MLYLQFQPFFHALFRRFQLTNVSLPEQQVLGLDNAGKTTIVKKMSDEDITQYVELLQVP